MKLGLKRWMMVSAAAIMTLSMCVPAFAEDKKITTVKIKLEGEEPVADEDIGSVSATIPAGAYYSLSSEDCYYTDEDDDTWERGTTPVVRVELEANDGYYFGSISKSKINVSGMHGEYKSSKVMDGGNTLRVDIKLRKVAGELSEIEDLYWDGKTAVWEEVNDADKYEIKLYRGTRTVTTVTTTSRRYDFYPYMTSSGDYSFKVRAVSNSDGETSSWTDLSEEFYMSSSNVYTGSAPDSNTGGGSGGGSGSTGGPGGSGSSSGSVTGSQADGGTWYDSAYGWWFRMADGNPVKNAWLYVDNNWFRMDANGFMMTGLQVIDGNIYYLNPVSDGTRGAMLTGAQSINGSIYNFSSATDGTRGMMLTGYQMVNGWWYFFDPSNGAMWVNTTAPNGRWIDGTGIVH